jgi:hypothetical protein
MVFDCHFSAKIANALTDTGLVPICRLVFTNADFNWRYQALARFQTEAGWNRDLALVETCTWISDDKPAYHD